jgi:hypothetical protein
MLFSRLLASSPCCVGGRRFVLRRVFFSFGGMGPGTGLLVLGLGHDDGHVFGS